MYTLILKVIVWVLFHSAIMAVQAFVWLVENWDSVKEVASFCKHVLSYIHPL